MKRIALIPAYQPEEKLKDTVNSLKKSDFQVIIVDDGSGSEYLPFFKELHKSATVLTYKPNHGKGHALKTGLRFISRHEPEAIIVTMDADGQHLVSDAVKLCRETEKSNAELVLGCRLLSRNAPARSRWGNRITRNVFRAVTGVKLYDTQSGLRAFRSRLIPFLLKVPGNRYEYEMNVLLAMAKQKQKIREIPIQTIYFDSKNSVSHFNAVRDSVKIYLEILKFTGCSLVSSAVQLIPVFRQKRGRS